MIKKDLSPKQQAVELIKKSKSFLIIPHTHPDGDAISSALALRLALEKMGKNADVAIPDDIPSDFSFLPDMNKIIREKKINRDLVVRLKNNVGKISYDQTPEGVIELLVTSGKNQITEKDVELLFGKANYEVLIVLDTPERKRANAFYEMNQEYLAKLPTINIDHHPTNVIFGDINIVDTTATSTCEIVFSLIEALDKNLIDEKVATLLLTGIISDTNRFQNANTTPKSLTVSAQLIASGAKRSDIIKNIFRTKRLSTLRLWGRILSGIKEDKQNGFIWSTISFDQMQEVGANHTEVEGVIDELLSSVPGAKMALLLIEREPGLITASMRTLSDTVELDKLAVSFGGGGHKKAAGFTLNKMSLVEAEKMVLSRVIESLGGKVLPMQENIPENHAKPQVNPVHIDRKIESQKPATKNEIPEQASYFSEEQLAPTVSDIDLDQPSIIDDSKSILKRIMDLKKEKEEKLDFAKMEEDASKRNEPSNVDLDEDYE